MGWVTGVTVMLLGVCVAVVLVAIALTRGRWQETFADDAAEGCDEGR